MAAGILLLLWLVPLPAGTLARVALVGGIVALGLVLYVGAAQASGGIDLREVMRLRRPSGIAPADALRRISGSGRRSTPPAIRQAGTEDLVSPSASSRAQLPLRQGDAAFGRCQLGPRQMQEDGAAAALTTGASFHPSTPRMS